MTMYRYPPPAASPKAAHSRGGNGKANRLHNELVEKAAENDEQLMATYFGKGNLDEDELRQGLKLGMLHHDVYPVFCLSAKRDMGSTDSWASSTTWLLPLPNCYPRNSKTTANSPAIRKDPGALRLQDPDRTAPGQAHLLQGHVG